MKLTLPFPPSVNTYWRAVNSGPLKGRVLISDTGRTFRTNAVGMVLEQLRCIPKPFTEPVSVRVLLLPPNRARRDLDNFQKVLFDALTHAGVWKDDSQIHHMDVRWGPVIAGGRAEVEIRKIAEVNQ